MWYHVLGSVSAKTIGTVVILDPSWAFLHQVLAAVAKKSCLLKILIWARPFFITRVPSTKFSQFFVVKSEHFLLNVKCCCNCGSAWSCSRSGRGQHRACCWSLPEWSCIVVLILAAYWAAICSNRISDFSMWTQRQTIWTFQTFPTFSSCLDLLVKIHQYITWLSGQKKLTCNWTILHCSTAQDARILAVKAEEFGRCVQQNRAAMCDVVLWPYSFYFHFPAKLLFYSEFQKQ